MLYVVTIITVSELVFEVNRELNNRFIMESDTGMQIDMQALQINAILYALTVGHTVI